MAPATRNNSTPETKLGALLKQQRQRSGIKLSEVEVVTKIRGRYLTRFEADDYSDLPNDVYVRGFVRRYGEFLGLNGGEVMALYDAQRGQLAAKSSARRRPLKRRFIFTPKILVILGIGLAIVAVLAYLLWQVSTLAGAPKLRVDSPKDNQVVTASTIQTSGKVEPGADLFINGVAVISDAGGHFSDQLTLQDGLNTIKFTAKSKLGKSTVVSRSLLVHLPSTPVRPKP